MLSLPAPVDRELPPASRGGAEPLVLAGVGVGDGGHEGDVTGDGDRGRGEEEAAAGTGDQRQDVAAGGWGEVG